MMNEKGRQRSQQAFDTLFPAYGRTESRAALASVIFSEGDAIDINLGDRLLYGGDAREISARQVKEFLDKPLRLVANDLNEAGLMTPLCAKMVKRLLEEIGGQEMRMPKEQSTFLIVFGLGLGHHLAQLIRETQARWVIVVEPIREFSALSPHAIDWSEIAALLGEREGKAHLVTELDPVAMARGISRCIREHGASYIDGSWVFTHYPLWAFAEARDRLLADADNMFAQCGFFEDELKMTRNVAGNFATLPLWLLSAEKRPQRRETAVIVGAGPSLDDAIGKLKEIRDRVVVFSGGTALRPLLRNGITPNFHCELENGPEVLGVLEEAGKHGDLSQITLIASLSLDPRIAPLFGERIFFFRENSSGTALLKGKFAPLLAAVPTCVNTALSAASFLGFTEFLLFGADCGVRPGRFDHAEGTVYRDIWKDRPDLVKKYPMEVEGNFGGIAMTNWVLDACKRILTIAIANFGLSVTNCSDGALIPGTTPKVPEAVEITSMPIDRQRLFAELKRTLVPFEPGELLASLDIAAIREMNRAMFAELAAVIDGFDPDAPDFVGVYASLVDFERAASEKYAAIHLIGEGTVLALARIGMYCGSRVADDDRRRELFHIFLEQLRQSFADMEQGIEKVLDQVRDYAGRFSPAEPERALAS